MSLKEVVNVTITRETKPLSQKGFGTMLFLSKHARTQSRVMKYGDLASVALDFDASSNEYASAKIAFSQNPCPVEFWIGKALLSSAIISFPNAIVIGKTYSFVVHDGYDTDGKERSVTVAFVASTTSASDLVTGLHGVFNTLVTTVSGLTSVADSATLVVNGIGGTINRSFSITGTVSNGVAQELDGIVVTASAFPSSSEATKVFTKTLDLIGQTDNEWYACAINSRDPVQILDVASWVEANVKVFFCSDADANAGASPDTSSVLSLLNAYGYARTFYLYKTDATASGGTLPKSFADVGIFANLSTRTPGSYTASFKDIIGVTADSLTETFSKNVRAKYGNTFELMASARITREGMVVAGEYLDVIIFCDWLQARITEALFAHLVRTPKVPFTDSGIRALGGDIKSVLDLGVKNGGIADDTPYTLTLPRASDCSVNDRALRKLTGVTATARLAGAIQAIDVNVTVTV